VCDDVEEAELDAVAVAVAERLCVLVGVPHGNEQSSQSPMVLICLSSSRLYFVPSPSAAKIRSNKLSNLSTICQQAFTVSFGPFKISMCAPTPNVAVVIICEYLKRGSASSQQFSSLRLYVVGQLQTRLSHDPKGGLF
jgi:hypothetical protein